MSKNITVGILCFTVITLTILLSGCAGMINGDTEDINKSTPVYGSVYIDGKPVPGAEVEAISSDGNYHFRNNTNDKGVYVLYLPKNECFNLTARYQGLWHTLWPVSVGENNYVYDISMHTTPKSFIAGTGCSVGGYAGYDNSRPLTGFTLKAIQVDNNKTLTGVINSDWSYSIEVEPGIKYHLEGWFPDVKYYYRNNNSMISDVMVGPNETALIDYVVVLP